jgi:2-phospho-L-lactate guanylyltransferase
MQATVASYDDESRSGTVVTDTGEMRAFTGEAVAEHIRHLRPGQRVHTESGTDGAIRTVRLWI